MADCSSDVLCSSEEQSSNLEQQRNETETLQSIFDKEISILKENTEYLIEVVPQCDGDVRVALQHLASTASNKSASISVTHIPVVTLYIRYPRTYPSHQPPDFHVSAWWLDPKSDVFIRDQLLSIFAQDCLVVYDWILYIQNDLIREYSHFQTKMTAVGVEDLSNPSEISSDESLRHPRQIFVRSSSQLNDMEEYDCYENHKDFQQSRHECAVCIRSFVGAEMCPPCSACGLVCCKECTVDYCKVCITEGQARTILCPGQKCSEALSDVFLEEILHKDLYKRYIDLREQAELDSIPGMVFCPRLECGARVISDPDSNLAQCTQCGFPFCKLCKQTWHGPGTCPAIEKLREAEADKDKSEAADTKDESEAAKLKLSQTDKKRVEELKSLIWIRASDNVKPCPKCSVNIQKNGGCNNMVCRHCNTGFCWLCETTISGYQHFDRGTCRVFRDEDYYPPEDTTPKEIIVPDDDTLEETMDRALMSVCPRCGKSESKSTDNNWIHCRHCKFQYCHTCREPCFGAWHFSEEYGCKRRTTSEFKSTNDNWIHCRHCKFQYCHTCREPCFGAWHFSEEYGCKRRTTVREDFASFDIKT